MERWIGSVVVAFSDLKLEWIPVPCCRGEP